MLELDKVIELYKKSSNVKPNKMLLNTALEAGMRKQDADFIYEIIKKYVELKIEPHQRQLKTLANLKHIPDRLYVILRKNFKLDGKIGMETR